jgi:hypothetical protein
LCHAGLATQPDNLDEKVLEVLAMLLAEGTDGAEIQLICGKVAEGDIAFQKLVDLPGTADALRVGNTRTSRSITPDDTTAGLGFRQFVRGRTAPTCFARRDSQWYQRQIV